MKIEDCKNSTEWDYLGYKKQPEIGYEYATDWQHITLMTKINMIRNMVLSNSRQYKPNKIKLHPNLEPLIGILVGIYGTRFTHQFSIVFDYENDEDIIFVYYGGCIDAIPLIKGGMLELRVIGQCSEEQIIEYKKSICGYIKILNYKNMEKEQTLGQKRIKISGIEGTPIDMSNWYEDRKKQELAEQERKQKEKELEKERIDKIECPVCKSTDKINHIKTKNNGIMGPGFSSWVTDEYLICKNCGVHYTDITKIK